MEEKVKLRKADRGSASKPEKRQINEALLMISRALCKQQAEDRDRLAAFNLIIAKVKKAASDAEINSLLVEALKLSVGISCNSKLALHLHLVKTKQPSRRAS